MSVPPLGGTASIGTPFTPGDKRSSRKSLGQPERCGGKLMRQPQTSSCRFACGLATAQSVLRTSLLTREWSSARRQFAVSLNVPSSPKSSVKPARKRHSPSLLPIPATASRLTPKRWRSIPDKTSAAQKHTNSPPSTSLVRYATSR